MEGCKHPEEKLHIGISRFGQQQNAPADGSPQKVGEDPAIGGKGSLPGGQGLVFIQIHRTGGGEEDMRLCLRPKPSGAAPEPKIPKGVADLVEPDHREQGAVAQQKVKNKGKHIEMVSFPTDSLYSILPHPKQIEKGGICAIIMTPALPDRRLYLS